MNFCISFAAIPALTLLLGIFGDDFCLFLDQSRVNLNVRNELKPMKYFPVTCSNRINQLNLLMEKHDIRMMCFQLEKLGNFFTSLNSYTFNIESA